VRRFGGTPGQKQGFIKLENVIGGNLRKPSFFWRLGISQPMDLLALAACWQWRCSSVGVAELGGKAGAHRWKANLSVPDISLPWPHVNMGTGSRSN
jgi:hypothetical protein